MDAQEASDEVEASNETTIMELEAQVTENPDDPALRFQLGLRLWETSGDEGPGMKEKAVEHFVVSAKLDPQNGEAFKYLGHYFSRFSLDVPRSIKCYQRAVSLNSDDSDAGESLCDLLDRSVKETLQISLCNDASQKSPRAFWAFKRMGLLSLHQRNFTQAIHSLQHAIRGYPNSPQLWEALGLSYHRLGMFSAATKSYGRAIELDGSCILALVESGNIYAMQGLYSKAVELFRLAHDVAPQNVAVNYGFASSLLGWANECMNSGAYSWGTSLLEEASRAAHDATCIAGNLFSLWKLQGDIKFTYGKCIPWMGEDTAFVDDSDFYASVLSWRKCCSLAAESARIAYQRALHLAPWNANLYIDVAMSSDLLSSITENITSTKAQWKLPEKMVLGALLLEGCNFEFWVALGQLSHRNNLKQHALIRGLQLNLSYATAWTSIGMLYRKEGELDLSVNSFNCARSMDPSLALPWAGVSADAKTMDPGSEDAFESCLRAVQILPLAELQVGLAKLAFLSGHLKAPQVYGAIQQAIKRAPHFPEIHNLRGLIFEARQNYETAVISYKLALSATKSSFENCSTLYLQDILINLTRCLSKANYPAECLEQCQNLSVEGLFDEHGQQLLALSLWQLGKNELALSIIKDMAMSPLKNSSMALICRLLYRISGVTPAIDFIGEVPTESLQNWEVGKLVYVILALDETDRLRTSISRIRASNLSHDQRIEAHYLAATAQLLKHDSGSDLAFSQGITRLKKALHSHPESHFLRNYLGKLLLSNDEWNNGQLASRCCYISKSSANSYAIIGATTLSCHSLGFKFPKFTFPTCSCKSSTELASVAYLQRWVREEPWNNELRYLLILNLYQKSREERFPKNALFVLQRLLPISLSNSCGISSYQKFNLLLCASEVSLQCGNASQSIDYAKTSLTLKEPDSQVFFTHLFLCRSYAAQLNSHLANHHFLKCIAHETDHPMGWVCLLALQLQYNLPSDNNSLMNLMLKNCPNSKNTAVGIFNLLQGLHHFQESELLLSEAYLSQSSTLIPWEPCVSLSYGAVCMELAREARSRPWVESCERSMATATANAVVPLPMVSLLDAQACGSLGHKNRWENALRAEWYTWPPDMRPAQVLFQMHLLANDESRLKWVLRAIHTNPSCRRYYAALQLLLPPP